MTTDTLAASPPNATHTPAYPHHWRLARLGEFIASRALVLTNGFAQGGFNEDGQGVPHLRPFNVSEDGRISFEHIKSVPAPRPDSSYWIQQGDIIFNNTNSEELVGKTAYFPYAGKFVLSNHMTRIRVLDPLQMDAAWLAYQFLLQWEHRVFKALCRRHVGQASIGLDKLHNLTFPLPPLAEQRAIARVLRAVQAAIAARRREVVLERERKAALMQQLFTKGTRGEPTKQTEIGEMPESWRVARIAEIADVAYGLTVNESRRKAADKVPYLTVANVTRGSLRLDEVKQIGVLSGDAEQYRLRRGDVLLVEGNGNPTLLGSAAKWNDELPFVLHQNHLIRARPDQSVVLPDWLMGYLNSDDGRAQLLGKAKTSSGLHSINSRLIANLAVPLPSMAEQHIIVGCMRTCDLQISALEREAILYEELFRALLEKLMTGQLAVSPLI